MVVEEAGQVLESHVLASLIDSIEHLVLIGDPLQLRPTLNNYGLSIRFFYVVFDGKPLVLQRFLWITPKGQSSIALICL